MLRVCYCLLLLLFSSASFAQSELTSAEIRAILSALKERGYDPGPVDGDYGQRTAEAIRGFEKATGLPVAGSVSLTIQQRLDAIIPETVARYRDAARRGRASALNGLGDMYANWLWR